MTLKNHISDGGGSQALAKVTSNGQLVVGKLAFDSVANATASSAATGYNLFSPIAGKQFVITGVLLTAKKDVTTDEVVDVYEADDFESTTIDKSLMQVEMLKSSTRDFIGLNLLVNAGKWVTVKSDDATTLVTCMGYYIDKL